jgi:hypothetical protein
LARQKDEAFGVKSGSLIVVLLFTHAISNAMLWLSKLKQQILLILRRGCWMMPDGSGVLILFEDLKVIDSD